MSLQNKLLTVGLGASLFLSICDNNLNKFNVTDMPLGNNKTLSYQARNSGNHLLSVQDSSTKLTYIIANSIFKDDNHIRRIKYFVADSNNSFQEVNSLSRSNFFRDEPEKFDALISSLKQVILDYNSAQQDSIYNFCNDFSGGNSK